MNSAPVHVAVGVIEDATGRILIARRPEHLHQGGLWEFPGGKVHAGESVTAALQRELHEELHVTVQGSRPLIRVPFDYGDKQVLLDVHRVVSFAGTAVGREGQAIRWVEPWQLAEYSFPAANRAILNAIRLPRCYMITAGYADIQTYLARIEQALAGGINLIQLRARQLGDADYQELAHSVLNTFPAHRDKIILNTPVESFIVTAGGIHLRSQVLMQLNSRPLGMDKLVGASVHNAAQLHQANKLGVDFMVLASVLPTTTHPDAISLGWQAFAQLASLAACPVYALGGLRKEDLPVARQHGAQGIAGISAFAD